MNEITHPSVDLIDMMDNKSLSQRELSSIIQVTPSVLNGIIVHKKPISAEIAVKLEAADLGVARDWLVKQALYDLFITQKKIGKKTNIISEWNSIQEIIPYSYFKKRGVLTSNQEKNIAEIYRIYNVKDLNDFHELHSNYQFTHYRKSNAFKEQKNNVIAWSLLAEDIVRKVGVNNFDKSSKDKLIENLNQLFYENPKTLLSDVKILLAKYGIKFETLDRPSKTPVDGKSFMSGKNPAIVLSLKYKRLDNFAFTIMHELGHVFLHLSGEFKDASFFINSSKNDVLEFEANQFARNVLIPENSWESFIENNNIFTDDVIYDFANKIKVHPAIVRGRVCFEYNNYYRRKSSITTINKIEF
jgi:HTH-type transcriptional regulator/antitoxin HigA